MDTKENMVTCLQDSVIDRISRVSGIPLPHGAFIRDRALFLEFPPAERSAFHAQINAILPICSQVGIATVHLDSPGFRRISCPVLASTIDLNSLDCQAPLAIARRLETLQRTLLPYVEGVLLICDRDGVVIGGNATRLTIGWHQDDLHGGAIAIVFPNHQGAVNAVIEAVDSLKAPVTLQLTTELLNGSLVTWQATVRRCGEALFWQLTPTSYHPWL